MAEDVLRYRVEIDPRQAESELGRLRSGVGSSLSGGAGNFGAGNSIRSDLAYASGLLGSPRPELSSDRLSRSFMMAGLEGALGATAVGATGFAASSAMFGVGATVGGIGAAAQSAVLGASSAVSSIGAGISSALAAAPTAAELGIAAIRLTPTLAQMGSVATAGLAMGATAGTAALAAVGLASAERNISDLRAGFDIQDQLTSRGFGLGAARGLSSKIVQSGRSAGLFTGAETAGIFQSGMEAGLFDKHMSDPEALGRKVTEQVQQVKRLMRSLNMGMKEASDAVNESHAMGIAVGDTASFQIGTGASGMASGLGTGVMRQAGAMGASMAAGMGMRGVAGAQIAQQSLVAAGVQASGMDQSLLASVGGQQGLAQSMARGQMNFFNTGIGQMVGMGALATGNLNQFMSGEMSLSQAALAGAQQVAGGGMMGGLKAMMAMDTAKSKMNATQIQGARSATILGVAGDMGLGASTEGLMTAVAMVDNIDMSTTEGRTLAEATARSLTDKKAPMLQLAAQNNAKAQIVSQNSGVYQKASDAYARAKDWTLMDAAPSVGWGMLGGAANVLDAAGRGMGIPSFGILEGAVSKARRVGAAGALEVEKSWNDWARRGALSFQTEGTAWGMLGGKGSWTGSMAASIFGTGVSFNTALGSAEAVDSAMSVLGVTNAKELGKMMISGSAYENMSAGQIKAEQSYRDAISGADGADPKMVSKALGALEDGSELRGELGGLTTKAKIGRVISKAGLKHNAAGRAAAVKAMKESGIDVNLDDSAQTAMGTRASKLEGELISDIGNLDFGSLIGGKSGETIAGIIDGKAGFEEKIGAAANLAAFLTAEAGSDASTKARSALKTSMGDKDFLAKIGDISSLKGDKVATGKFVESMKPLLVKAIQQGGAALGNLATPDFMQKLAAGDINATKQALEAVAKNEQSVTSAGAANQGQGTPGQESVLKAIGAIEYSAAMQVQVMGDITTRLEALAGKIRP